MGLQKIEMEASGSASVSSSSGAKAMQDLLEGHKEWSRAVVYDQDGKVLASTFDVDLNDIEDLLPLFNDEDNAFRFGIDLGGEHYDVHRFYDALVYGRKVDQKTTGSVSAEPRVGTRPFLCSSP